MILRPRRPVRGADRRAGPAGPLLGSLLGRHGLDTGYRRAGLWSEGGWRRRGRRALHRSGLRAVSRAGAAGAAGAAVAIALDSIGAAFLNATVGTEVGARAEEAGQNGSPNGIVWLWVFHNTR